MSQGIHVSTVVLPNASCPEAEHVHIVVMPSIHLAGYVHPTHERRVILHSPGHRVVEAILVWNDAGPCAGWEEP